MSHPLQPGSRLGPYEVIAPLSSSGGMATLFLGRRTDAPERRLAIKVARAHLARDPGYVAMFQEEARLGMWMAHPNLIRTEGFGEQDGVHYLAMEYVSGVSLAELLGWLIQNGRVLRPEMAVHIAICVARALSVAHVLTDESGRPLSVVHRDVSPQNVLLSDRGEVKLIDFGVAKASHRQWATVEGSLKGKLGYMSPEQASAKPIDHRTDVYALGVVLWETLAHLRLFDGEPSELLPKVQKPRVERPSLFAMDLSSELDAAVMKALAVPMDQRFQTANAFEQALSACPEAAAVDVELLGALVTTTMIERKLARDVQLAAPSPARRSGALQAVTMELPISSRGGLVNPVLPASAFSVSPPTRVSLPPSPPSLPSVPAPAPSPFQRVGVITLVAVMGLVASAIGAWWLLGVLAKSEMAAAPGPASSSAPASVPASAVAPSMNPVTPGPEPYVPPAEPPLEAGGWAADENGWAPEESGWDEPGPTLDPVAEERRERRHRRRAEDERAAAERLRRVPSLSRPPGNEVRNAPLRSEPPQDLAPAAPAPWP